MVIKFYGSQLSIRQIQTLIGIFRLLAGHSSCLPQDAAGLQNIPGSQERGDLYDVTSRGGVVGSRFMQKYEYQTRARLTMARGQ